MIFVFLFLSFFAQEAFSNSETIIIASYDTQFDISHNALYEKIWTNPGEVPGDGIDNDKNGYIDDIHGWNFGDNNNILYSPETNIFTDANIQYSEYSMRRRAGIATHEELHWLEQHDDTLGKYHRSYIGFLHGTSSASVNLRGTKKTKLVALRVSSQKDLTHTDNESDNSNKPVLPNDHVNDSEIKQLQEEFVTEIYSGYREAIEYAAKQNVRVFQIGFLAQLDEGMISYFQNLALEKFKKNISHNKASIALKEAYKELLKKGKTLLDTHPQILFVTAAGNSTTDLDQTLSFPQGISSENKLVVGASIFRDKIAPFSSFGKNTVDALISTVNYYVAVPDDKYMLSSATSVSVVILTNLATLILEENPKLTTLEVKDIILSTVIKKDFLKEITKVSGIIYSDRALEAARNSRFMSVEDAIKRSFQTVRD